MDNVAIVKDMYAAFARTDIAAVLSHVAEDSVWSVEEPASIPWTGVRQGHEGILAQIRSSTCACTMNATGKHVDSPIAHYWRFRDGKAVANTNIVKTAAYL